MSLVLIQEVGKLLGLGSGPYTQDQLRLIEDVLLKGRLQIELPDKTIAE